MIAGNVPCITGILQLQMRSVMHKSHSNISLAFRGYWKEGSDTRIRLLLGEKERNELVEKRGSQESLLLLAYRHHHHSRHQNHCSYKEMLRMSISFLARDITLDFLFGIYTC